MHVNSNTGAFYLTGEDTARVYRHEATRQRVKEILRENPWLRQEIIDAARQADDDEG